MVSTGELNLSRYLRQRLGIRYQTKLDFNAELSRIVCSPYSPGSLRNITVLDFKSNMLAEQFTYLDWFYFKKIEVRIVFSLAKVNCPMLQILITVATFSTLCNSVNVKGAEYIDA